VEVVVRRRRRWSDGSATRAFNAPVASRNRGDSGRKYSRMTMTGSGIAVTTSSDLQPEEPSRPYASSASATTPMVHHS
jgi:hypothetical protein